jgi:hypothetical protein
MEGLPVVAADPAEPVTVDIVVGTALEVLKTILLH